MLVWLNGHILPAERATVSVLDRGFLFGDGVYEVVRAVSGVPLRLPLHIDRLARSLALSRIEGFDPNHLDEIVRALLTTERLEDATVYVQVTRGTAPIRRHLPEPSMTPTVVAFATAAPGLAALGAPISCRGALRPDMRWLHCAIKSTSLLGNVLGVMEADDVGADEAILFRSPSRSTGSSARGWSASTVASALPQDDDLVGEGSTSNVWAVIDGTFVTPPIDADPPILHGVTRLAALAALERVGMPVRVEPITVASLRTAPEIMLTSARRVVASIVALDGAPVGDGVPGPMARALATAMRDDVASAIDAAKRTDAADANAATESSRQSSPQSSRQSSPQSSPAIPPLSGIPAP